MTKTLKTFLFFTVAILVTSCAYNKEQLPSPENGGGGNAPYNGPIITYTSHVKTIIDNNCIGCHSGGQPPNLTTYSGVQAQAATGRILARVINGSPSFMPPSGSLPQADIDTVQFWLDQGFPQ